MNAFTSLVRGVKTDTPPPGCVPSRLPTDDIDAPARLLQSLHDSDNLSLYVRSQAGRKFTRHKISPAGSGGGSTNTAPTRQLTRSVIPPAAIALRQQSYHQSDDLDTREAEYVPAK